MTIALYVVGLVLILVGLVGLVLPGLPGSPVIFAGFLSIAWADGFTRIGWPGLLVLGLMSLVISVVDYLAGVAGARRSGASAWGLLGAVIGLIAGMTFGIPGLILGPFAGALLLEYLKDPDFKRAARVGVGSLIGFLIGTVVKYALALFMIGAAILSYLL